MAGTNKVAISLPDDMFNAIEKERKERGESRSELFRRAIEMLLRRRREEEKIKQYIRGYEEMPETEEETRIAAQLSRALFDQEPW